MDANGYGMPFANCHEVHENPKGPFRGSVMISEFSQTSLSIFQFTSLAFQFAEIPLLRKTHTVMFGH